MKPEQLVAPYQLGPVKIHPPQTGYRNTAYPVELAGGHFLNLIVYKSEPGILDRITAADYISNAVAAAGLPTRQTQGRILKLTPNNDNPAKYARLYNYLPGRTIPWEAYTMDHIKLLGLAMSRLHHTLAAIPTPPNFGTVIGESQALLEHMRRYFDRGDVTFAMRDKLSLELSSRALGSAQSVLKLAANLPNHQPLHMDFVRGNILFDMSAKHPEAPLQHNGLAITGIIDFEKTSMGPRVFDVARTLAFLLVDCKTKTPAQVAKYFLHSGYNKRGAMQFDHPNINVRGHKVDLLQQLANFYLLHDFYKFLRHNPYEFLPQNEHFMRTQALLSNRRLLSRYSE